MWLVGHERATTCNFQRPCNGPTFGLSLLGSAGLQRTTSHGPERRAGSGGIPVRVSLAVRNPFAHLYPEVIYMLSDFFHYKSVEIEFQVDVLT